MLRENYYIFLIVIIMMSSISLFGTDIYLASLPEMAAHFNCTQVAIQASFTSFLLGLAGCQLVVGILSDWFGKKRIILMGLFLFTVASLLCARSETLSELILFRLLQAIGGGVGSVNGRAIIASRYDRSKAIKIFSTIFPVIGLSAAIGPLIGGYLTYFFSWRATFYFMIGFGLVTFILVWLFLENDKNQKKQGHLTENLENALESAAGTFSRLRSYFSLIRNVEFVGYALIVCAGFCVFRSYTVESPFVFDKQGYVAREIGHFYIILSVAYIIGNLSAKVLVNKISMDKVLRIGLSFFALGGFCMIISAFTFERNPYAIILPMGIVTLGNGFLFPVSSAGAMTAVPGMASGLASGFMGALQFILAAFCIHWIGTICQGQAIHMSVFLGTIILLGTCSYLLIAFRTKSAVVAS